MELTTQPLSMMRAFTPRRFSSIPHARPVGPAPTMTASRGSTSEHAFHGGVDAFERGRKRGGIFAACFRHVRPATAATADGLSDLAHELAGMHSRGEVLCDGAHDGDVRILA